MERSDLTQPYHAAQQRAGVTAQKRIWRRYRGGLSGVAGYLMIAGGVAGGVVAGWLLGMALNINTGIDAKFAPLLLALLAAPAGGYGGHVLSALGGFHTFMIQVFFTERASVIQPEIGTAQAEVWMPKTLMDHRSHEWRYEQGRPYMWLMTPLGSYLQEAVTHPLDVLTLPNDPYFATDAAVYLRRSINRLISDVGVDFKDVDSGERPGDNMLLEYLPYFVAAVIVMAAVLVFLFSAG